MLNSVYSCCDKIKPIFLEIVFFSTAKIGGEFCIEFECQNCWILQLTGIESKFEVNQNAENYLLL